MPDLKLAVAPTSIKVKSLSRHDMLKWVNSTVHGQYKKIEELCSGVAYCQLMELLFPNTVGYKKIKCNAKFEHEFLHNLRLFQSAFTKIKIDKSVPIDRLMKGKFQDNFEFLQWFKEFFDAHSVGKETLKMAAPPAAQTPPNPTKKLAPQVSDVTIVGVKFTSGKTDKIKTSKNEKQHEDRIVSPSSIKVLQGTQQQLAKRILSVELERDTYYQKLVMIETIITDSVKTEKYAEWCKRVLDILYTVDDTGSVVDMRGTADEHTNE